MALQKMEAKEVRPFLNLLFPQTQQQKEKERVPERWSRIEAILDDKTVTPLETRNTLWGLYNAVVRDEDYRSTREANAEARLNRVWFGAGHDLKLRALAVAQQHLKRAA
jgi:hypothetical protein